MALLPLILGLLAAGAIAGVLAGLFGVGGGAILVPVLYQVFEIIGVDESVRMHLAVATSLATIIPTTIRAMMKHHEKGAVDYEILRAWVPGIIIGVVIGSFIAKVVSGDVLALVFAIFAMAIALNMGLVKESWTLGKPVPKRLGGTALAGTMGVLSTLMGLGGGAFGVTALSLFGVPIHRAVATAAGFGLAISIPGALGYVISGWEVAARPPFSIGYVNLIGFALIVPATVLTAPIGVRLAHSLDRRMLRRLFAVFLALMSARMFWAFFS